MKKRLFIIFLAVVLILQSVIVCFAEDSEITYSNAYNDLIANSNFDPDDYPELDKSHEKYYSLEVITIAESENGELFVYVYQPSGDAFKAASIDISVKDGTDKDFINYDLTYLNHYDRFFKYKVEGFKVSADETRYYEISDILRPWSKDFGDKEPGAGNTISEVGYPVGKLFTFTGDSMMDVEDVEYIVITDQYLGFIRVEQDLPFEFINPNTSDIDCHFVAFSTNKDIDKILEVSLIYDRKYIKTVGFTEDKPIFKLESESEDKVCIDFKDNLYLNLADGNFFTQQPHVRQRIQRTSDFLDQKLNYSYFNVIDSYQSIEFEGEALEKLSQTQWVICFAESVYSVDRSELFPMYSFHRFSNVKVMRLKFMTAGKVYNLGVVGNKQTGSKDPAAVVEKQDWWQKIMMVLMLIVLLFLLTFIQGPIGLVFKFLWRGIKIAFKILVWILSRPWAIFRWLLGFFDKHNKPKNKGSK